MVIDRFHRISKCAVRHVQRISNRPDYGVVTVSAKMKSNKKNTFAHTRAHTCTIRWYSITGYDVVAIQLAVRATTQTNARHRDRVLWRLPIAFETPDQTIIIKLQFTPIIIVYRYQLTVNVYSVYRTLYRCSDGCGFQGRYITRYPIDVISHYR